MAGRGGGRFGRGRGRGFPVVRDEDGMALIPKNREGPPPLFPPISNLPVLPDLTAKDERELQIRRHFEAALNVSPYFIEKPKVKAVGLAAEIERYSDRYKLNAKPKRPPLSSVLKLAPAYFPAELLGQDRSRKHGTESTGSQWTLQTGLAKSDLLRLDRLATLEQKQQKNADEKDDGDVDEKKKKDGEEGDGDDDDEDKVDDEEEEDLDDDYAQTFGFDDDEDYMDMDDGGDDEGAVY